jgi:hypothetical protein
LFKSALELIYPPLLNPYDPYFFDNNTAPYITLTILLRYVPRQPIQRAGLKDADKVTKESALWLVKEEAQSVKDPVLALVYWEVFFQFYFEGLQPGLGILFPSSFRSYSILISCFVTLFL